MTLRSWTRNKKAGSGRKRASHDGMGGPRRGLWRKGMSRFGALLLVLILTLSLTACVRPVQSTSPPIDDSIDLLVDENASSEAEQGAAADPSTEEAVAADPSAEETESAFFPDSDQPGEDQEAWGPQGPPVELVGENESEAAEGSEPEIVVAEPEPEPEPEPEFTVSEDGHYTSRDEVALYIHLYGHLPDNFVTKREAQDAGWSGGGEELRKLFPGASIGGSRFGNYEGLLPEKRDRKYYECDIDFDGRRRGAKRIVYSNDGLIFYTDDHYESFVQLYDADGPVEDH